MTANTKDHSGSLTREKFLLPETRTVARLLLDGLTRDEIVAKAKDENIFQFPTTRMAANIANVCLARLDGLEDGPVTRILATGTPDQARQANVYLMMRHYDLVRALLADELGRRYAMLDYSFTAMDLNAFVTSYREAHPDTASWADSTVKRIKGTLRHILLEGGYIAKPRSEELQTIFLDPDVEDAIRAGGDESMLPAFNCSI